MHETDLEIVGKIYKLIQGKEVPKAITLLNKLLIERKYDTNLYHLMGIAYFQNGSKNEAISWLEKAIEIGSNDPELFNNLGNFCKLSNQFVKAEKYYKQALEFLPSYVAPKESLLQILIDQDKLEECEEYVGSFLTQHPNNPAFHNVRGELYRRSNFWERAVKSYNKAIKYAKKQQVFIYLNNLGLALLELCEFEEAKSIFIKAVDLDASKVEPKYNLSTALFELGDYQSAKEVLEDIIASFPSYLLAHKSINEILYQTGFLDSYGCSYKDFLHKNGFDENFAIEYLKCLLKTMKIEIAQEFIFSLPNNCTNTTA